MLVSRGIFPFLAHGAKWHSTSCTLSDLSAKNEKEGEEQRRSDRSGGGCNGPRNMGKGRTEETERAMSIDPVQEAEE